MPDRARIAFAICAAQVPIVQREAPRFGAVADIVAYPVPPDGPDAVVPALAEAAPHVVVTDPRLSGYFAEHLDSPVVPLEFTIDVLAARIAEARRTADRVAILAVTGSLNPAVQRLVGRIAGPVPVYPWSDYPHLHDLITRCRRRGVQAIVGGCVTAMLAAEEGMRGLSLYDRPGELDGAISQMIFTAATLCAPRLVASREEMIALGFVLERICEGAIGAHDTVLHVDARWLVAAAFPHRCGAACGVAPRVPPVGAPLAEALEWLAPRATSASADTDRPTRVEFYPLTEGRDAGYVVVVRGERAEGAAPVGPLRPGCRDTGRLARRGRHAAQRNT